MSRWPKHPFFAALRVPLGPGCDSGGMPRTSPVLRVAAVAITAIATMVCVAPSAQAASLHVGDASQKTTRPAFLAPYGMADTGGGSQLITVVGPRFGSRDGLLIWWQQVGDSWQEVDRTPARFGWNGLKLGTARHERSNTTPTGLFSLPFAFGKAANPGTAMPYRKIRWNTYWCSDSRSHVYNRWRTGLPSDCQAARAEHMTKFATYVYGLATGFNYANPVPGRGSAIFVHAFGAAYTAGCVSIKRRALVRLLQWLSPASNPHIAIGTNSTIGAL